MDRRLLNLFAEADRISQVSAQKWAGFDSCGYGNGKDLSGISTRVYSIGQTSYRGWQDLSRGFAEVNRNSQSGQSYAFRGAGGIG